MRLRSCCMFMLAVLLAITLPRTPYAADNDFAATELTAEVVADVSLMELAYVGETMATSWLVFAETAAGFITEHSDFTAYTARRELMQFSSADVLRYESPCTATVAFHLLT